MSPVLLPLRPIGSKNFDLAHRALDVTRIPMDAVAVVTYCEGLVRCVDEWRDAAGDHIARNFLEQLVAGGASGEGKPLRIERIALDYFAELVAKHMAFNVENVGCGAQALVTCQKRACLRTRET